MTVFAMLKQKSQLEVEELVFEHKMLSISRPGVQSKGLVISMLLGGGGKLREIKDYTQNLSSRDGGAWL